jgi:hypothetical protein
LVGKLDQTMVEKLVDMKVVQMEIQKAVLMVVKLVA